MNDIFQSDDYISSQLDKARFAGYASGLFPGLPVEQSPKRVVFRLAMGRKVLFDLERGAWREDSPAGIAAGFFNHDAAPGSLPAPMRGLAIAKHLSPREREVYLAG